MERGVSEVVGSLLVFAVIISTASILYVMSYPTLKKAQDEVNYRSAASNLFEIRDILNRIRSGNEPQTTKKIYLYGGSLHNIETSKFKVDSKVTSIRGLVMNISDKRLYLDGSGVFEEGNTYTLTLLPPLVDFTTTTGGCDLYITIYNISGNLSVGGREYTTTIYLKDKKRVTGSTLEIYTNFPNAWGEAINNAANTAGCSPTILVFGDHVSLTGVNIIINKFYVEVK